jgi:hypothetical protein
MEQREHVRGHSFETTMTPTHNPTLDEFLRCARREFDFLVSQFGFHEEPVSGRGRSNEYQVRYAARTTRVIVEGVNWGYGVDVRLEPKRQPILRSQIRLPLWAIVQRRNPSLYESLSVGDQLTQLAAQATALLECARDVLGGDFSVRDDVARIVEEAAARERSSERERGFRAAMADADAAFRSKDYRRAAEILARHEDRLAPAHRAKLDFARRKTH